MQKETRNARVFVYSRVTKLSDTHTQGGVSSELQYTQKVAPTQAENRQKTAAPAVRRPAEPMLAARNIHYDLSDRTRAIGFGGIGAIHLLARKSGLIEAIDRDVQLLKVHLPYHESDHVLNIAYNILCDGHCLEDLERLRNDEAYLDAWRGRIPDPTTAGDFAGGLNLPGKCSH